jgi:hypothetical protein
MRQPANRYCRGTYREPNHPQVLAAQSWVESHGEEWRSCISCDQTFLLTPGEVARFNGTAAICEHCERLAQWAACDDGRDRDEFIDF